MRDLILAGSWLNGKLISLAALACGSRCTKRFDFDQGTHMKSKFFFGVTRFSVYAPGSNSWKLSKDDVSEEEYLANLYSDERLSLRFEIFTNRALPVYQKMASGRNYRHIVQYSDLMPEKWKEKLFQSAVDFPVILLQEVKHTTASVDAMLEELKAQNAQSGVVVWFRVDDDDLLSVDYLEQLEQYAQESFGGMAVSFGSGITAAYANGKFKNFRLIRRHLMSQGQAYIGRYDAVENKIRFPRASDHTKTDITTPVVIDSRKPAYVWVHHESQDTSVDMNKDLAVSKIDSLLAGLPRLKQLEIYSSIFPTIYGDISADQLAGAKLFSLSEDIGLSKPGRRYEVHIPSGWVNFKFVTQTDEKGVYNDGIICFDIESDAEIKEIPGLNCSANRNIGWYRYLPADRGELSGEFDVKFPEGVRCKGFIIQSWVCKDLGVTLKEFTIQSK